MRRFRLMTLMILSFSLAFGTSTFVVRPVHAQSSVKMSIQVAIPSLNLYSSTDLGKAPVMALVQNSRMVWDGSTQTANGRKWLPVIVGKTSAFISPNANDVFLIDPNVITPAMNIAARGKVVDVLSLYQNPDPTSVAVKTAAKGSGFLVIAGPTVTDLGSWWQIKLDDGTQGWFLDTLNAVQVTQPLSAHNFPVCDGYNLLKYGASGWDPIVADFPTLIPASEKVACLMSVNFNGDGTPFVVVLGRGGDSSVGSEFDTLHVFIKQSTDTWLRAYEYKTDISEQTNALRVVALGGKPALLWSVVHEGTGRVMDAKMFRYTPITGFQQILSADQLYQGAVVLIGDTALLLQPDYKANEPNCCHLDYQRTILAWQNGTFVNVVNDLFANPSFLQGIPQS